MEINNLKKTNKLMDGVLNWTLYFKSELKCVFPCRWTTF